MGCPPAFGHGVVASYEAEAALTRFRVERGAQCGLHLARSTADLREGRIAHFTVGVCLSDTDLDLGGFAETVTLDDNTTVVRSLNLPVPDTVDPLPHGAG
jgi:hypothetical protein